MQDVLRDLAPRYAALLCAYRDALVEPDLVEPTSAYFPDPFEVDAESVAQMLKRLMTYAPLGERVGFQLAFAEPEESSGGCGSGACGPGGKAGSPGVVSPLGNGHYGVVVQVSDVGNRVVLASVLARAVGGMVLYEAGEAPAGDVAAASELSAAVCGLGLLLLNGSSVYKKGCGGLKEHRATELGVESLAAATALFCGIHRRSERSVRRHLATTQAEAFDEAMRWVDGNETLLHQLRNAPEGVAAGAFEVEGPRGFLSRLFGGRRHNEPTVKDLARVSASRTPRSAEQQRRLDEARALVEQALAGNADP